jgi:thioesterase domain-containing protein/acyl carrier protein
MVVEVVGEVLEQKNLNLSFDFFQGGGTSLSAVSVVLELSERLGLNLPLRSLFDHSILSDWTQAIERLKAGRDELLEHVSTSFLDGENLLVRYRQGKGKPLFIVHSSGGHTFGVKFFADALRSDLAVYGINAVGVVTHDPLPSSLGEFARRYVAEVLNLGLQTPLYLGGYSAGAPIAWEMAQQMKALGQEVEALVFFDGWAQYEGVSQKEAISLREYLDVPAPVVSRFMMAAAGIRTVPEQGLGLFEQFDRWARETGYAEAKESDWDLRVRIAKLEWSLDRAFHEQPALQPLAIPVILFRPGPLFDKEDAHFRYRGWNTLSPEVTLIPCQGDHFSLLQDNQQLIAETLDERLGKNH